MVKIKVYLQNNKEFETEVDTYDAVTMAKFIAEYEGFIVPIGDRVVNKHHIEYIHKL